MDRAIPALFALGIAVLLVASPFYLLPNAGKTAYEHHLEEVPASEVPEEADVRQYENLSSEARAALRDARTDDGVVYGVANEPPEFFYSDNARLGRGVYYIQQDDTYYRLTTFAGGGLFPAGLYLQRGLVVYGLAVGVIGYVSLGNRRRWLPVGFGTLGGVLLGGVAFGVGPDSLLAVGRLPLLLATVGSIVVAVVVAGATASR